MLIKSHVGFQNDRYLISIMSTHLLNEAKLIKTSAVGCAAQAASILQKQSIRR